MHTWSNYRPYILCLQKTALAWSGDTKPGGAGGGSGGSTAGGTQGLAHWMSVMAEHMNHEAPLHPAYMWHNGIDQKMSITEQQQLLQKGIQTIQYMHMQYTHCISQIRSSLVKCRALWPQYCILYKYFLPFK